MKNKHITIILLVHLLMAGGFANAQTISRNVISTAGGTLSGGGYQFNYNVGETAISTLSGGGKLITQGFEQPGEQIRTGAVSTSVCPGSTISVPYTAIDIGGGNTFTAQLSNASGSFAAPVSIGTATGNASGSISATIPLNTLPGTNYRIRVVSNAPVCIGTANNTGITVNLPPAPVISGNTLICGGGSVTLSAPAAGIINQRYASTVINFSSQYTPTDWSANQTLGAPNVYPSYGSNPLAWSPNGDPREFITLGFTNPSPINYIDIYETYKPGAIDTVYVKNPATGLFEVVYSVSAAPAYDSARVLHISFPMTTFNVSEIRIAINDAAIGSWNEIDAVAIGTQDISSYLWSTGASTQTISVNTSGTFTVTVTNASGCTGTASVTTGAPVITGNLTFCTGSSTTLSTGVNSSYLWSTGATTQNVSVNTGGTFTVTVTNTNGCTGTASIQVTKKAKPTVTVTPSAAVICPPNVSVSLTAGGTASTFAWSPATGLNQTAGASVTAIPAATTTYIVTGTSTAGCTATKTATVTVKPKPVNLLTTNITASSAITKWDTVACAVGYKLQYRKQGVTAWTSNNINSNSPTKNLSGLLAASSYQWRVKSKFADGTYSVNSNIASFTTLVLRSGMETIESTNELVVYPNPATDKLTLEFPFTEGDANISIVNALGQTVLTQKATDTEGELELNIQSLPAGLYFIAVQNGGKIFNSRFIKN